MPSDNLEAAVAVAKTVKETATHIASTQEAPNFGVTVMAGLGVGAAAIQTLLATMMQPMATVIGWVTSKQWWLVLIMGMISYGSVGVFMHYVYKLAGWDPRSALFVFCVLCLVNVNTISTVITKAFSDIVNGVVERVLTWVPKK